MKFLQCLTSVALIFSLAACGGDPKGYEPTSTAIKPEGRIMATAPEVSTLPQEENFGIGSLESLTTTGVDLAQDSSSEEYKQTYGRSTAPLYPVYFSFDSRRVEENQLKNLNSSIRYLKKNPSIQMIIEGNTDSRGTNEYNMALGESRALAAKKHILNSGVSADRISTTSYGFQRPLYHEENETAWAKNRRADLVIAP